MMGKYGIDEPSNEMQVREWFVAHMAESTYDLVASQEAFPDYILADDTGKLYRVEVEYKSSNFIRHRHDPEKCDFILCWVHDTQLSLPVLELSNWQWYEANAISKIQELTQQCTQQRHRTGSKYKPVRVIENRNLLLEIVGNKVADEYNDFLLCFAINLQEKSKLIDFLAPSQLRLLEATRVLTIALKEWGVDVGDLHPDDLFKLMNT